MSPHVADTDRGPKNRWHPCYTSLREWLDNEAPEETQTETPTPRKAKARNLRVLRRRA